METAIIECADRSPREINRSIKERIANGQRDLRIVGPGARHNLGVGLVEPVSLRFDGSVGYYCMGLIDGPAAIIEGDAGWGLAEGMLGGTVVLHGAAGNGAGAAMRGGALVVHNDCGARAGVSMKGGTLVIGGDCGYMTGFMGQKGVIIVCGDAGPALGDSMYETVVFVGGHVADPGTDTLLTAATPDDILFLQTTLAPHDLDSRRDWKKIVSGRKLWNFDRHEAAWREIL